MKTLSILKKSLSIFLAMSLFVAFANTYFDSAIFSNGFMSEDSFSIVESFDIEEDSRIVASAESELPAAQYLPANKFNKDFVNRKWEITRILNEKKEVVFDVFNKFEDKNKLLVLDFEMIGTSQVRIDGDDSLIFDISLLNLEGKTIVLFRSFGEGYEIIEARKRNIKRSIVRFTKNLFTKEKTKKITPKKLVAKRKGLRFKHVGEALILERAIVPTMNNGVFKQFEVGGELILGESSIESMSALVAVGSAREDELPRLDYVKVNDGGQFSFEDEEGIKISGVITNNGNDGYRIRIATGKYAGTMLNFVTNDEFLKLQEKEREMREREEEIKAQNANKQVSVHTLFSENRPTRLATSR